jgi:RimK-like ATP-grasp domain
MPIKRFYIYVNPIGSKFAKGLQSVLQSKVKPKILRTNKVRQGRSQFSVTINPLNKIEQFQKYESNGISCPGYATTVQAARELESETLFARTIVNGTNGVGIIEFARNSEDYPRAPLYTAYIAKKEEYRVHVFNGEVIDIQQKKKRRGYEGQRDTRIRNSNNGYVYCRDGINPPDGITSLAISAVAACGYQYGAVDIIYNQKRNQCYVLEVNSRPGLMGTTLDKYSKAIIKAFNLEVK